MSISAESTQSWVASHKESHFIGDDLPWLKTAREQSLQQFSTLGLPGVKDEQWRHTNLRALKSNAYLISATPQKNAVKLNLPASEGAQLVFIDGYYSRELSDHKTLPDDVVIGSMAQLLSQHSDVVEKHLGSCISANLADEQHGFSVLNTAFWQDGLLLVLPKNTVIEKPIEVYFVQQGAQGQSNDAQYPVQHVRNLVIANANSQASIVERHISIANLQKESDESSVYLNNSITEIHSADNAHVDHYKLQQESPAAFHIGGVFINQSTNSQVKTHTISLNGLLTRNDTHSQLLGQGAHIEMNGLVLGKGDQHIDNHTQVNHTVANCTSDEYYKTVLDDKSRSVFRGRIVVAQDAQQTIADQQNNNLLLSKHAEADCKPQLEIYADDVKCSHGATVGQLDAGSLFYLRSRGIDKDSAVALLTFAFANQVIERIQIESIRSEISQVIAGRLLNDLQELL